MELWFQTQAEMMPIHSSFATRDSNQRLKRASGVCFHYDRDMPVATINQNICEVSMPSGLFLPNHYCQWFISIRNPLPRPITKMNLSVMHKFYALTFWKVIRSCCLQAYKCKAFYLNYVPQSLPPSNFQIYFYGHFFFHPCSPFQQVNVYLHPFLDLVVAHYAVDVPFTVRENGSVAWHSKLMNGKKKKTKIIYEINSKAIQKKKKHLWQKKKQFHPGYLFFYFQNQSAVPIG